MQDPAVKQLIDVLLSDQRSRYSGGVERFLARIATEAGRQSYEAWKNDAVTRLFLDALKAIAETGAGGLPSDATALALAHGSSCGINLAIRLMEDPTRVFPSIFDGNLDQRTAEAPSTITETYTQSPDPVQAEYGDEGNN